MRSTSCASSPAAFAPPGSTTASPLHYALLTARSSLRTHVEATEERFDDSIETAAYFVCSEALANTTKHARATAVSVRAARRNGCLTVRIRDDGIGGARLADGSGLLGLSDRVAALGGSVTIESAPGKGTTVTAELPCGS